MSFHLNNAQQMAINDSLLSLTERERKYRAPGQKPSVKRYSLS